MALVDVRMALVDVAVIYFDLRWLPLFTLIYPIPVNRAKVFRR